MASWYTVNHGAMVAEQTFSTEFDAEMFALVMTAITGLHWNVELVTGMPI